MGSFSSCGRAFSQEDLGPVQRDASDSNSSLRYGSLSTRPLPANPRLPHMCWNSFVHLHCRWCRERIHLEIILSKSFLFFFFPLFTALTQPTSVPQCGSQRGKQFSSHRNIQVRKEITLCRQSQQKSQVPLYASVVFTDIHRTTLTPPLRDKMVLSSQQPTGRYTAILHPFEAIKNISMRARPFLVAILCFHQRPGPSLH